MTTRVSRDVVGIPGLDECNCGRRATILHCTACGSTRVYARSNRPHKFMNGETKFVEIQFRCQTCGHLFIQEERQWCDAPPVSVAQARLKVQRLAEAAKSGEYLRPNDQAAAKAISELLAQENETPPTPQVATQVAEAEAAQVNMTQPSDLSKEEFFNARHVFIGEWTQARINDKTFEMSCDEYVKRRFNGEVVL